MGVNMLWYETILNEFNNIKDKDKKISMEKYMKNKFEFYGVQSKDRINIEKSYFTKSPKDYLDWDFINFCWNQNEREMQYVGINYLKYKKKFITHEDIKKIEELITCKSWWDSVDNFNQILSHLLVDNKKIKQEMIFWSKSSNIWLRRSSILSQLKLKEKTDEELLTKVIKNNLDSSEFFINKSIGWALREYSKSNSFFVTQFIYDNKENLSNLSIKEASKYL